MAPKSKARPGGRQPKKPYPDFPLFPHPSGRWCKKIRGKHHYFGPVTDDSDLGAQVALAKYQEIGPDLHAGRTPRPKSEGATLRDLFNKFLTLKKAAVESGELSPRTFSDYLRTCEMLADAFGLDRAVLDLAADDFGRLRAGMATRWGPHRLAREIQQVRTIFKYGFDSDVIDRPIRFGPSFKRPPKRTFRKLQAERGSRMFEAHEIRAMLEAAKQPLKAMICVSINCGYGNASVGCLPFRALDFSGGWANYEQPKTRIQRRCPLWPETVESLREAIAKRPKPKRPEDANLVFLTKQGYSWHKQTHDNPLSNEMAKLLRRLKIHKKQRGFYGLRRSFETIGGETLDQVAVDHIMGHADQSMAAVYRERISDDRLRAVVDHVQDWLFGGRLEWAG